MMNKRIPEGKLARTGVAGIAAAKVGMGELKHKMKRPFLSQEASDKEKELLDDKNAKVLFKALTQLRGTALKVAQMLGMEQGLLPDSYRKELSKSFHQVPPLNRVLVRKVMIEQLQFPPEKLYSKFNANAFAAASLGQVHEAELLDHNEDNDNASANLRKKVAVKVQYPGIGVSISSDMALMRGIAKGMSNTQLILQSLNEIEARLNEEIDYRIEAKNTQWFADNTQTEGISIPKVYSELSTERVLTTEFITGLHLDQWLATKPSQQKRNTAAQRLYDFFMHSTESLQCLHADPNPGNYLFKEDGTITVIDFGCVRHLSDDFITLFPMLMKAYIEDSPEDLFKVYRSLGMIHAEPNNDFYQEILRPFGQWVIKPFQVEQFDFADQSDYTLQGKEPIKRLHEMMKVDRIVEEFIFHNRTLYGLYQIFEKMGATVKMRHPLMGNTSD